jgi:hypothetical protein
MTIQGLMLSYEALEPSLSPFESQPIKENQQKNKVKMINPVGFGTRCMISSLIDLFYKRHMKYVKGPV